MVTSEKYVVHRTFESGLSHKFIICQLVRVCDAWGSWCTTITAKLFYFNYPNCSTSTAKLFYFNYPNCSTSTAPNYSTSTTQIVLLQLPKFFHFNCLKLFYFIYPKCSTSTKHCLFIAERILSACCIWVLKLHCKQPVWPDKSSDVASWTKQRSTMPPTIIMHQHHAPSPCHIWIPVMCPLDQER